MKVSVKTRRRNPQQYLLESALRYYENKDTEFIRERTTKLLARLLGADAILRQRGEPILTMGVREALYLVYTAHTPVERVEVRKGGRGATQKVIDGGTEVPSPRRLRRPHTQESDVRLDVHQD